MLDLSASYPYFVLSLMLLGLFSLGCAFFPRHRRSMLFGALLATPTAFYEVIFVPEYWDPVQLFRFGAGPEDLIFSFSVGGLVWLVVPAAYHGRDIHFAIQHWRVARACAVLALIFLGVWLPLWQAGMEVMRAEIVATAVLVLVVLALRPRFWRLAVVGPPLFALPYTVLISLVVSLRPEFLAQWNLQSLSDFYVLGVPVEETAWALSYGAAWPLLLAYFFDLRLSSTLDPATDLHPTGADGVNQS